MTDSSEALPAPRFVTDRPRAAPVTLEWPIEYAGRTYTEIYIARLTTKEVADFMRRLAEAGDADKSMRMPVYRDADGAAVPDAVLDALDDDDQLALDEVAASFIPRRFRGPQTPVSDPANGAPTAPTSAA